MNNQTILGGSLDNMRVQLGVLQSRTIDMADVTNVNIILTVYSLENNYFSGVNISAGFDGGGRSPGSLQINVQVLTLKLFGGRFLPSVAFTIVVSCIVASQGLVLFGQFAKSGYSPVKFIRASGWRWLDVLLLGLNLYLLVRHMQLLAMVDQLRASIIANADLGGAFMRANAAHASAVLSLRQDEVTHYWVCVRRQLETC